MREYIKPNITEKWLKDNHFSYYYKDNGEMCFKHIFPVHRDSGGFITLECKLLVWFPSGEASYTVQDSSSKGLYSTYHLRDYGNASDLINKIDRQIFKEFKNLGIKEKKNETETLH